MEERVQRSRREASRFMEDAIEVMLILVVSCELKWTGPGEAKRFASIQAEGCVPLWRRRHSQGSCLPLC